MIEKIVHGLSCMTEAAAVAEANRCLMCHDSPCTGACPASVDVMHFIRSIRFQNVRRAEHVIRQSNVLGAVCGSVCPRERLCEGACLRSALKDPIRIGELQTFAASTSLDVATPLSAVEPGEGPRAAVVGAGPAGIAAAAVLAGAGADVTIFESRDEPGGMLAYGVPESRMPYRFVRHELNLVLKMGVRLETGRSLGADFGLDELFEHGFGAVFIGVGLWKSLRLPGISDVGRVRHALPFLEAAASHFKFNDAAPAMGDRCAVIGGGSVAMDCAHVAKELGAGELHLVSLEGTDELPATWEDVTDAFKSGVQFWTRRRVTSVDAGEGSGLVLRTVGIRWREEGLLVPSNAEDVPGSDATIPVDDVIVAIGQAPDGSLDEALSSIQRSRHGLIKVDPDTQATSDPRIWAGGDCAQGCGRTVVASVAEGRKAGVDMARHLGLEVRP